MKNIGQKNLGSSRLGPKGSPLTSDDGAPFFTKKRGERMEEVVDEQRGLQELPGVPSAFWKSPIYDSSVSDAEKDAIARAELIESILKLIAVVFTYCLIAYVWHQILLEMTR